MDISDYASKFKDWKEYYDWDTCKANRKEFGSFIAYFLTTDSRVINLDGTYGSGKTEFIRRLYIELAKTGHPVVYIDAWESDFSNNPLAVICSELLQQIEFVLKERAPNGKKQKKNEAKKVFNKMKGKLGTCLKYLDAMAPLTGDPAVIGGTKAASTAVSAMPDFKTQADSQKYVEIVQKKHIEAVQAVNDIKEYITFLSGLIEVIYELKIPIVILIDELDRCKPTYAIEVLEVIKHFFETKGCTFLVATNTSVLEHSVKSVYGQDFDAKLYLRKFFDRKINLPKVSLLEYLMAREFDFDKYQNGSLLLYPFIENQQDNIGFFAALFESNDIELRDVEQILNRFFASLDSALNISSASYTLVNTVVLMVGLMEQHLDKDILKIRTNKNAHSAGIKVNGNDDFGYSLGPMINCMLKCVTTTTSKTMHGKGRFKSSYHTPITMLEIQANVFPSINWLAYKSDFDSIIVDLVNYQGSGNCNYWMWEDHQKVIELSGHIE